MLHQPLDETLRVCGQEPPGIPDDPAPHAERCTRLKKWRCADSSTLEPDGRWHDGNTAASLGQRKQRLRIAGFEDDSRIYVSNAAGTIEHLSGTKSLSQQQNAFVLKIDDIGSRLPCETMHRRHCGHDTDGE